MAPRGGDHAGVLIAAFEQWLGEVGDVAATEQPWASATFAGTRHLLSFSVAAGADVEQFAREITEAELPLRRAFVADVGLLDRHALADGGLRMTVDVLVIDEA